MTNESEPNLNIYEIAVLSGSEDFSKLRQILSGSDAQIIQERPVQKIKLSYPIKKFIYAFFQIIDFKVGREMLADLNSKLRLENNIIRYMITAVVPQTKTILNSRKFSKPEIQPYPIHHKKYIEPALTNEALEKKIEEILK